MSNLQFTPLQSNIDISFWSELSRRKLQDYKLSEEPVTIYGFCSCCKNPAASCPIFFDRYSFPRDYHRPGFCKLSGELYVFNTIENFDAFDQKSAAEMVGQSIRNSVESGRIHDEETNCYLLQKFILLVFADLKNYEFTYWFAFPALKLTSLFKCASLTPLSQTEEAAMIPTIDQWLSDPEHFSKPFFTIPDVEFVCFLDPSHLPDHPSWLLRNLLVFLNKQSPQSPVKVLCLRQLQGKVNPGLSKLFEITIPDNSFKSIVSGWQSDHRGHKAPKKVNLRSHFDPQRLSEDAVNLNTRLMLWRAAPNLDVESIFATKCLLIGMGTLGCAVARCLLAWGITHLTLIDNGVVSFSNPVRQSLYEFEDCLENGKSKVEAAAEHLKRIYPSVVVHTHQMTVPMPGHPPFTPKDQENTTLLHQLIASHDVIFLLTDNRESRWLPTVISYALSKIVINAALGYDSYLVMRHGQHSETKSQPLGCYFCNDVLAPSNSIANRTLDQQCTVVRPGLAPIAGALAVELMISLLHHEERGAAEVSDGPLGALPHMIRGSLFDFSKILINASSFHQCVACAKPIVEAYLQDPIAFVSSAICNDHFLQNLTGLTELIESTTEQLTDWEINED